MPNKSRERYENEFIRLIQQLDKSIFGQRGTNSQGVDVLLFKSIALDVNFKSALAWRVEVKTSTETHFAFNHDRDREQHQGYQDLYKSHAIPTFYAFRQVGGKESDPLQRWRLFDARDLPQNKAGNPTLALNTTKGWTLKRFYERFIA